MIRPSLLLIPVPVYEWLVLPTHQRGPAGKTVREIKRKITDETVKYDSIVQVDNSSKLTRFEQSWFSRDSVTVCLSSRNKSKCLSHHHTN